MDSSFPLSQQTMPDPRLYESDHYVVLETNQAEQLFTRAQLLEKLEGILRDRQDDLPKDLQRFTTVSEQAVHLLETSCEFDLGATDFLQWYIVRLEKP